MTFLLRRVVPPCVVALVFIGIWQLVIVLFGIEPYLLPSPMSVVGAASENSERLIQATFSTGLSTLTGFLLASVVGVFLGSLLGLSRWLERGFYPPTLLLQMVPLVAIAPLFVIWFGFGFGSTVTATVVVAIFPVIANTLGGIRSTDSELRQLFRFHRAGRFVTWWKLELPSATPGIITGLRVAAGLSVIGAITAEFVSGYTGESAPLGSIIIASVRTFQTDLMFASVLIASLVGFTLFGLVNLLGWFLLHSWHSGERS
jgi:NitT/TauT family transport system permease protein